MEYRKTNNNISININKEHIINKSILLHSMMPNA